MPAVPAGGPPLMAEQDPRVPRSVDRHARILVEIWIQPRLTRVSHLHARLHPLTVIVNSDSRCPRPARVIESRSFLQIDAVTGVPIAVILAPVRRTLLPSHPDIARTIDCHVGTHFSERSCGHLHDLALVLRGGSP